MEFKVLGPVEIWHSNSSCTPTAAKVRWTLALLLSRANQVVERHALLDELWGEAPPRSAVTTMQTYIYKLRRIFTRDTSSTAPRIHTRLSGYVLHVEENSVDSAKFKRLVSQGERFLRQHDPRQATERLRSALALWRGPALADLAVGRVLEAHVTHLEELRIKALGLRITADRLLGRAEELLPELRELVVTHPLNERFHGELMHALTSAGRRAEAMQAYQSLCRILGEELGLEPSLPIQRLHDGLRSPCGQARGNANRSREPFRL